MKLTLKHVLTAAMLLAVSATSALAQRTDLDVPEVGMSGLASAATLVTGGYLVLKSKFRRSK